MQMSSKSMFMTQMTIPLNMQKLCKYFNKFYCPPAYFPVNCKRKNLVFQILLFLISCESAFFMESGHRSDNPGTWEERFSES